MLLHLIVKSDRSYIEQPHGSPLCITTTHQETVLAFHTSYKMIFMQFIAMGVFAVRSYLDEAEERRHRKIREAEEEEKRQRQAARDAEERQQRIQRAIERDAEMRERRRQREAEERRKNKDNFGGFRKGFLL